jgi:hypothetical protein
MRKWIAGMAVLATTIGLGACGGGGSQGGAASIPSNSQNNGLTVCLAKAGFQEPETFVATVVVEGTERLTTVTLPPSSADNFLVVYEAPTATAAKKAEANYSGGPFIARVGKLLFASTGDAPNSQQQEAVESCLKPMAAG